MDSLREGEAVAVVGQSMLARDFGHDGGGGLAGRVELLPYDPVPDRDLADTRWYKGRHETYLRAVHLLTADAPWRLGFDFEEILDNEVSGSVGDGPVAHATLEVRNKHDDLLLTYSSDEQASYTFTVKEKGKEIALPKFGGGISSKDIAVFTRQFSVMIDAGLPLVQCLEILGQQQDNKAFQKVLLQVRQDVEGGLSLAEALRKHPQAFDDLYVNMVAAGEAGLAVGERLV